MCSNAAELSAPPKHILLSPLMGFTLTCRCGLTLALFIAGMCGRMSSIDGRPCVQSCFFGRSVETCLQWIL